MSRADVKVVLLGNEAVGKTSLMERYIHDRFNGKFPHQNTIGAAFASREVSSRGRVFLLGIWDTAGSERYYAMTRLYYRDAKAAVVCFDVTDLHSYERAKQWVIELRNHEQNCKLFICGTKKDTVDAGFRARAVSYEKALQYSKAMHAPYLETSSKTGENVEELFQMIANECELPPMTPRDDSIQLHIQKTSLSCCSSSS